MIQAKEDGDGRPSGQTLMNCHCQYACVAAWYSEIPSKTRPPEAAQSLLAAKGRDKRPEFDRLLKDATRRQFDLVMAWSVDRLGRSLQDLVGFLGDLHSQGVDLYLHIQGLDTTTPGGKALFQMMGVFAEFELAIIQERVCAGLAKARAQGKRLGRPKVPPSVERSILAARAAGKGQLAIARELRVGVGTVRRVLGLG